MKGSMIYLASPYNHPNFVIRSIRAHLVAKATAHWLEQGVTVYSPIVHNKAISKRLSNDQSYDFWMPHNLVMLSSAKALWVLMIEGWEESKGIKLEVEHAKKILLPISYIAMP